MKPKVKPEVLSPTSRSAESAERSPLLRVDPVKEAGGLVDAHLIEESVPHLLRFDMGVEGIDAGTAEGGDVQVTGVGTTEGGAEDCVDALPEL